MRPPVSRGFKTPPEVTRYFEQKSLAPAFSWQDVWGEEHAHAFTVAKAVELELLTAFKTSLQSAIENGWSFDTWRANILPQLERLGWGGPRRVDDPTGVAKPALVDFTRPRRLQTIFWSNVRAARAAGQWERAQRTKAALPYFLYVRTTSQEPRPEHLAWAGVMLPVDDPFWSTHFPPNGWGCKCSVRQIARREYESLRSADGYTTDAPPIAEETFVNRRTGEVSRVPAGVDPGWQTNPGLARAKTLVENYTARLKAAGEEEARKSVADFVASPAPRWLANAAGQTFQIPAAILDRRLVTLDSGKLAGRKPEIKPADLPLVQKVIDEAGGGRDRKTFAARIGQSLWRLALSTLMRIVSFTSEE